jgi:hypothetical protein
MGRKAQPTVRSLNAATRKEALNGAQATKKHWRFRHVSHVERCKFKTGYLDRRRKMKTTQRIKNILLIVTLVVMLGVLAPPSATRSTGTGA